MESHRWMDSYISCWSNSLSFSVPAFQRDFARGGGPGISVKEEWILIMYISTDNGSNSFMLRINKESYQTILFLKARKKNYVIISLQMITQISLLACRV